MHYETQSNESFFTFEIEVKANLGKVWQYVSDTDRANQFLSEPAMAYRDFPLPQGGSKKQGSQKNTGFHFEFEEKSSEWVEGKFFQIVREYTKGPFIRFIHRLELKEIDREHTLIQTTMRVILRFKLLTPIMYLKFNFDVIPKFKNYYRQIEHSKENTYNIGITEIKHNLEFHDLSPLLHKFATISHNDTLSNLVASFILKSQEIDLVKIRPYRLAAIWHEDKKDVLDFFLRGTKEGFFDLNWDLLCPACRGAKSSYKTLAEMEKKVHCSSCNIDYNADFDKSVELTFTPNPSIRKVVSGIYCASGPGSTPHLKSQIRVAPNQTEEIEYSLLPGIYKIYSLQNNYTLQIQVSETGDKIDTIHYTGAKNEEVKTSLGKKRILLTNPNPKEEITIKLEHAVWLENIVTAAEVTAKQEFRELFSSQVLRPGEEIGIKNLSVLFTDLKGSTEFYNTRGDAFAYKAVSSHFDILIRNISKFDGAIVKTIGDAIMGVFLLPVNAVSYALQIQRELRELNKKEYGENVIVLKVGIHSGPVLAVNQNEKLDYFGKTVNLAARVEGKCKGGDIVITKVMYEDNDVKSLLVKEKIQTEIFSSNLKGFEESSELVRLILD